jgi:hypothetical protein
MHALHLVPKFLQNKLRKTLTPNLSFLEGHQTTNLKLNYLDLHIGQGSS